MLKKNFKKLKTQQGFVSIIFVILIMIGVIMVTGFRDLLFREYFFRELQSIMEISQVSALRGGVTTRPLKDGKGDNISSTIDNNWHRLERLVVNEGRIEDLFKEFVLDNITVGGDSYIKDLQFKKNIVKHQYDSFGFDDGVPREYVYLDSTIGIKYENKLWDKKAGTTSTYYDAKTGNNFTISYIGRTEDGLTEILIRSVSRIVLI